MEAISKKEHTDLSIHSKSEEMPTGNGTPFPPEVLNTERVNSVGDKLLVQGNDLEHGTAEGPILEQETGLETALRLLSLKDEGTSQTRSAVETGAASGQLQQAIVDFDPLVVNKDNLGNLHLMGKEGSTRVMYWSPGKTHGIVEDPEIEVQFFWVGTLDLD